MADEKTTKLHELTKQLQALHDPVERHAFYWANPELKAVYSEGNFHPKPAPGSVPVPVKAPALKK